MTEERTYKYHPKTNAKRTRYRVAHKTTFTLYWNVYDILFAADVPLKMSYSQYDLDADFYNGKVKIKLMPQ